MPTSIYTGNSKIYVCVLVEYPNSNNKCWRTEKEEFIGSSQANIYGIQIQILQIPITSAMLRQGELIVQIWEMFVVISS